jgi:hypothetical protein
MLGIVEKIVTWLYEYFQKRRSLETELEGLKAGLMMTMISNHLDAPLHALRDFFIRNPRLLEKNVENRLFVNRWLMDPHWQAFGSVSGMWTKEHWDQLRLDANSLRAA